MYNGVPSCDFIIYWEILEFAIEEDPKSDIRVKCLALGLCEQHFVNEYTSFREKFQVI